MTVSSAKVKAAVKVGVTLAVVVVMMLATVGAWEIYKGTVRLVGNAHADGVFDLLKCYSIKGALVKSVLQPLNQKVMVLDEFKPQGDNLMLLTPQLLCTPAKKLLP